MKRDTKLIVFGYIPIVLFGFLIPAGRPGSAFDIFSVLAIVVGTLMLLRQELKTRIIGYCLLCVLVVSMVLEKRDAVSFARNIMEMRIKHLEKYIAERQNLEGEPRSSGYRR